MPISDDQGTPAELRPSGVVPQPEAPSAPSVADGVEHRLDPKSITVDRIGGAIFTMVATAGGLFVVLVLGIVGPLGLTRGLVTLGGWLVLSAALGGFTQWWPAVRYRHTAYQVSDEGIRIRRGVLWRSNRTIPRSRVQHTDVSQGPVERLYELATLVIYTAGTHHASVSLGGLPHERALLIRDHLIAGGEDDAV